MLGMAIILPELPDGGRYTGYWRVSTDDQNPQMQIDALVGAGVPSDRIYGDKMTGSKMDRPGLKRAMRVTRDKDVLVVWKMDRLGRSTLGVLDAIKTLEDGEIGLVSLTEMLDTKSPIGRMVMKILLSFAEMERELISERTKAGMKAFKERGGRTGPKHGIRDCPVRLAAFEKLWADGRYPDGDLSERQVVDLLNALPGSTLPEIKSPNTLYNWKRKGFPGWHIQADKPLEDTEE